MRVRVQGSRVRIWAASTPARTSSGAKRDARDWGGDESEREDSVLKRSRVGNASQQWTLPAYDSFVRCVVRERGEGGWRGYMKGGMLAGV